MAEMSLAGLAEKLGQTWPARLAKDAYKAVTLPGDVYQGNVSMYGDDGRTNPEVINRSMDLAGLVTGGSYAAPAMRDASGMGIRAYHGSPHDFDRFDLSKIGTGEGAQAYGHGMYFAENEAVARGYRDALAKSSNPNVDPNNILDTLIQKHYGEGGHVVGPMGIHYPTGKTLVDAVAKKRINPGDIPDEIYAAAKKYTDPGHMYEVNINADPAHFLDWDKSLSAQPRVTEALVDAFRSPARERRHMEQWQQPGWSINQGEAPRSYLDTVKGGTKYQALAGDLGDWAATSRALQKRGIPGIKYLDQGSRGAGTGSSNYVVFNPDTIEIMRKYGLAGMGSAAGLGAMAGQQEQGF